MGPHCLAQAVGFCFMNAWVGEWVGTRGAWTKSLIQPSGQEGFMEEAVLP